jgi:hypothetical protein
MKPLAFKPQTLRPVHAISDGWVGPINGVEALLTGLSGMRLRLRQTSIQRYVVRAAAYYMMNCACEN